MVPTPPGCGRNGAHGLVDRGPAPGAGVICCAASAAASISRVRRTAMQHLRDHRHPGHSWRAHQNGGLTSAWSARGSQAVSPVDGRAGRERTHHEGTAMYVSLLCASASLMGDAVTLADRPAYPRGMTPTSVTRAPAHTRAGTHAGRHTRVGTHARRHTRASAHERMYASAGTRAPACRGPVAWSVAESA